MSGANCAKYRVYIGVRLTNEGHGISFPSHWEEIDGVDKIHIWNPRYKRERSNVTQLWR